MKIDMLSNDVCKEIFIISSYLDCIKIPDEIFNIIVDKAALSSKEVLLNRSISLEEQLSADCLDFIALFYYNSVSDSARDEIFKCWEENFN